MNKCYVVYATFEQRIRENDTYNYKTPNVEVVFEDRFIAEYWCDKMQEEFGLEYYQLCEEPAGIREGEDLGGNFW